MPLATIMAREMRLKLFEVDQNAGAASAAGRDISAKNAIEFF